MLSVRVCVCGGGVDVGWSDGFVKKHFLSKALSTDEECFCSSTSKGGGKNSKTIYIFAEYEGKKSLSDDADF